MRRRERGLRGCQTVGAEWGLRLGLERQRIE